MRNRSVIFPSVFSEEEGVIKSRRSNETPPIDLAEINYARHLQLTAVSALINFLASLYAIARLGEGRLYISALGVRSEVVIYIYRNDRL